MLLDAGLRGCSIWSTDARAAVTLAVVRPPDIRAHFGQPDNRGAHKRHYHMTEGMRGVVPCKSRPPLVGLESRAFSSEAEARASR